MYMKDYLVKAGDVFNVEERLRLIDDGYRIYYNRKLGRFEVHNIFQKGDSLAIVVPYDQIDARLVPLVRRTRVENAAKIFAEIDEQNEKQEKRLAEVNAEQAKAAARERLVNLKSRLQKN